MTETTIRVRYAETDQMGHVYYANYLVWMELARTDWCRVHGIPYEEIEARGYFLPVVEVGIRYKSEIKYPDDIRITAKMTELKRASTKFDYQFWRGDKLCAEGFSWHVLMGKDRKAATIPDELRSHFVVEAM